MPKKRNTKPDRPQKQIIPAGKIEPDAMYTAKGCKNWIGIGRLALMQARCSGIVKPVQYGREIYYMGGELIEWIQKTGKPAKRVKARAPRQPEKESATITTDPVSNAIYQGIKPGIDACMNANCFGSALILVYTGIDAMAFLSMPIGKDRVTRKDFIAWCNRFLRIRGSDITGEEFYKARCGIVHTFGIGDQLKQSDGLRILGYTDEMDPPVRWKPNSDNLILLSVAALVESFYRGIDQCLPALLETADRAQCTEGRLRLLFMATKLGETNV